MNLTGKIMGFEIKPIDGLYMLGEDGAYLKLASNVPYVKISEVDTEEDYIVNRLSPSTFECTFTIADNRKNYKNINRLVFGTNNWRRRHGLPMVSYKRYLHERKE